MRAIQVVRVWLHDLHRGAPRCPRRGRSLGQQSALGGGQSMQAALTAGKQAAACVIYYGMPEDKVERLKSLNCDVLDIYGTKDQWINTDLTKKFETNMKAAGKTLTVKSYDADHGFANPSNPLGHFNAEAYKDAYKITMGFFKAKLK